MEKPSFNSSSSKDSPHSNKPDQRLVFDSSQAKSFKLPPNLIIIAAVIAVVFIFAGISSCFGDNSGPEEKQSETTSVNENSSPDNNNSNEAAATEGVEEESLPDNQRKITSSELGKEWPLNGLTETIIACSGPADSIYIIIDGGRYALNGSALTEGIPDLPDSLWKDDPDYSEYKVSIDRIMQEAFKLCNNGQGRQ